jgi:outer membrane protein
MNKKVLTLILVIVTATSTNAMAQNIKKWSLRQCIDYAMDNNIQLQKSKISENVAETELKQAKAGLLPNLSGSMTQSLSYRPFQKSSSNFVNGSITSNSSNKTIQNGSYGINANWTVWNGGINTNSIKSKQKDLEITRLESMQQANSIQEQITQLYVQILYSSDAVKVNKEINKKDSIAYVQGQEMLKAGKLSRSDLQQLKAAVSESGYAVVNSITQVRNYKLQLKQLLELQPGEEFDITPISTDESLVTSTIPDKMDVYSTALASRPEIISGKYNIESSELQLKIAKAGYMPTVSLTGGIGDNHMTGTNENFGNQMKYNLSGSVGLTLSIPIFDNRQTKSAIEKAKYNYANAQLDLTDKEKDLYSAIETYWLNATSNQQRFIAAKSNVESQQENNDLISEQFRLGLKDIVELTTSRSSLLQAKQEMLESKYMTLLNVQLLKFYSGEEIKL